MIFVCPVCDNEVGKIVRPVAAVFCAKCGFKMERLEINEREGSQETQTGSSKDISGPAETPAT